MKNTTITIGLAVALAVMTFAGGCASMRSVSLPSWSGTSSPSQIVATWDPVIRHEGDKVYRGLAARVIFYDASSKKALRVKGDFDVYVFDENDKTKKGTEPAKIVRYMADDLKHLESNSKLLGKTYTIWVPWDEVTDESQKKRLSVFVRFKATDGSGAMVVSHQTTLDLPGSNPNEELEETVVEDPYSSDQKMQMARLERIAEQRRNNPNGQNVEEWKGTVAEYIVSRENRPMSMVTTTMNMPGVSRNGVQAVTPERKVATVNRDSISEEQMRQAQALVANAQLAQRNEQQPINQVQFQSPGQDKQLPQQFQQPVGQQFQQPIQQQIVPQQPLGNYAAAPGTAWR